MAPFTNRRIESVAGIEARGFILGGAVADRLRCGFVPIRKKGKLPAKAIGQEYELEYGIDIIEIHEDALKPGEPVLLVNYEHLPVDTPYRASHAIYVREREQPAFDEVNAIPPALLPRLLAVRGFDTAGMMLEAEVGEGRDLAPLVRQLFGNPGIAYLHAHFARRGCFAARIDRA